MTERMHPQDLRTLVAACLLSGQPAYRDQFREASTSVADAFIAELERTAKPDTTRTIGDNPWVEICDCSYRMVFTQNLARCCPNCGKMVYPKSGVQNDRVGVRVKNPCAGLEFDVKRFENTDNGLMARVVRMKMEEMIAKEEAEMVQKIKDEGARAERERIIQLLADEYFLRKALTDKEISMGCEIRKILEPKP